MKLIQLILENLNSLDSLAFIRENQVSTYFSLRRYLGAMIRKMYHRGLRPADRVVLISDHDEEAVLFLAAASALGLEVVMPYNLNDAAASEWSSLIDSAEPNWIVYLKKDQSRLSQYLGHSEQVLAFRLSDLSSETLDVSPVIYDGECRDNFLVLFTSGTTGKPKAISISESLVVMRILSVSKKLQFDTASRIWMSGLINNTTGVIFAFGALARGASLVFPQDRQVENWPVEIDRFAITHLMLRPAVMRQFINGARAVSACLGSLKVLAYGAAAVDYQVLEEGRQLMPCQWIQGYGLSETYGPFCWLDERDHQSKRYLKSHYCIGKPDNTLDVKITDDQLMIQGKNIMRGYYSMLSGQIKAHQGWFETGDMAQYDSDGCINLKGRSSLTLLTEDGHKVCPEEVEAVTREIDEVDDALFVNFSGAQSVANDPVLCLVTHAVSPRICTLVHEHFRKKLSHEKWPNHLVLFKQPFPKSANDKVDRQTVANHLKAHQLIPFKKARAPHESVHSS